MVRLLRDERAVLRLPEIRTLCSLDPAPSLSRDAEAIEQRAVWAKESLVMKVGGKELRNAPTQRKSGQRFCAGGFDRAAEVPIVTAVLRVTTRPPVADAGESPGVVLGCVRSPE
jgi:hypothetical protein